MAKSYYIVPFFIPLKGCPNLCIFCDQNRITGSTAILPEQVGGKIERYLSTMPPAGVHVEAGFFGGSFTGLAKDIMKAFLDPVKPFIASGRIKGIRVSTRPDLIDAETVSFLRENNVICIELGVQSMSDRVLAKAKRGHTAYDTEKASALILKEGMFLGHQMMVGLPDSRYEDELFTASRIKEMGASIVRIYPVVVVDGTGLAGMYEKGEYEPLSMEEAVERSAVLINYFEGSGIKVIRCGLHPSEGFFSGQGTVRGPFHVSFGQMARKRASQIRGTC